MPSTSGKPPSMVELQSFIRSQVRLRVRTCDGESLTGRLKWFDDHAFCLILDDESEFTIMRSAIIGYGRS